VPTTRNVGRSSGRVRRRAWGLPYPASGQRSRPSVALHVCFLTGAPRRQRPGRCPLFHVPIPPATSTDCPAASRRGEAVIPWPVVRGPMAVALPRSRSPRPLWARHYRLCSQRWRPVIGQERRRVWPVIAPPLSPSAGDQTPSTQVKVRTRAK